MDLTRGGRQTGRENQTHGQQRPEPATHIVLIYHALLQPRSQLYTQCLGFEIGGILHYLNDYIIGEAFRGKKRLKLYNLVGNACFLVSLTNVGEVIQC